MLSQTQHSSAWWCRGSELLSHSPQSSGLLTSTAASEAASCAHTLGATSEGRDQPSQRQEEPTHPHPPHPHPPLSLIPFTPDMLIPAVVAAQAGAEETDGEVSASRCAHAVGLLPEDRNQRRSGAKSSCCCGGISEIVCVCVFAMRGGLSD